MTRKNPTVLALPFALALVFSVLGCSPEVPAMPTYTNDVQPILLAHCVRCHGANNMLNAITGEISGPIKAPRACYLQRFADEGDCTDRNDLVACHSGAGYCGTIGTQSIPATQSQITFRISNPAGNLEMPPPPADPLNDWEKEVLRRWSTANPAEF